MPAADGGVKFDYLMQFFAYEHLKTQELKDTSKLFADLAQELMKIPSNPERSMAFRKLLEAKDCAVRAQLFK